MLTNGTIKVIITLLSLLFLNIEAAQAGLVSKLKIFIRSEFPENQLLYLIAILLFIGFFSYVLFSPLPIGSERWPWYNYFTYNPHRRKFNNKRAAVRRISSILRKDGQDSPVQG